MSFTPILLVLATVVYILIGLDQLVKHNPGMGVAYMSYAVANAAMIWLSK
jgi:hypothetical protein